MIEYLVLLPVVHTFGIVVGIFIGMVYNKLKKKSVEGLGKQNEW